MEAVGPLMLVRPDRRRVLPPDHPAGAQPPARRSSVCSDQLEPSAREVMTTIGLFADGRRRRATTQCVLEVAPGVHDCGATKAAVAPDPAASPTLEDDADDDERPTPTSPTRRRSGRRRRRPDGTDATDVRDLRRPRRPPGGARDREKVVTPAWQHPPRRAPGASSRALAGAHRARVRAHLRRGSRLIGKDTLTLATKYKPRLGLDLEGGTSVILTPRVAKGSAAKITKDALNQAVNIIRSGSTASVSPRPRSPTGRQQHRRSRSPASRTRTSSTRCSRPPQLRFRPVLAGRVAGARARARRRPRRPPASPSPTGSASPSSTDVPTPTDDEHQQQPSCPRRCAAAATATHAGRLEPRRRRPAATPRRPPAATPAPRRHRRVRSRPSCRPSSTPLDCSKSTRSSTSCASRAPTTRTSRSSPATTDGADEVHPRRRPSVLGHRRQDGAAPACDEQPGRRTGGWVVNLDFNGEGTQEVRRRDPPGWSARRRRRPNQFAHRARRARRLGPAAPTARSSTATRRSPATSPRTRPPDLANVLKYGALPLTFDAGEVQADLRRPSAATSCTPA